MNARDINQVQPIAPALPIHQRLIPVQRQDHIARVEVVVGYAGLMDFGNELSECDEQSTPNRSLTSLLILKKMVFTFMTDLL